MEHSRIILGEKVYKELNPTSKEKKGYPQQLADSQQLPPFILISLSSLSFISTSFTPPFYTPSLGLDWLSDSAAITDHIQPSLCVKRS